MKKYLALPASETIEESWTSLTRKVLSISAKNIFRRKSRKLPRFRGAIVNQAGTDELSRYLIARRYVCFGYNCARTDKSFVGDINGASRKFRARCAAPIRSANLIPLMTLARKCTPHIEETIELRD